MPTPTGPGDLLMLLATIPLVAGVLWLVRLLFPDFAEDDGVSSSTEDLPGPPPSGGRSVP